MKTFKGFEIKDRGTIHGGTLWLSFHHGARDDGRRTYAMRMKMARTS